MIIVMAVISACLAVVMFTLLWQLTVNETIGIKLAMITGYRPRGDTSFDKTDIIDRVSDIQMFSLITGLMLSAVSLSGFASLLTGATAS